MSAPTDLEDLGHGRGKLRPGPAQSVRRLDVLLGRPLDINSAYRDWGEQQEKYEDYLKYLRGGPWAPLALPPDQSWHCKGMAIDTDDRLGEATFREHGWLFEVRGEPWHGQYYTSLDKHYGKPSGDGSVPFPTPTPKPDPKPSPLTEGTKDMQFIYVEDSVDGNNVPGWALLNVTTGKVITIKNDGSTTARTRAESWDAVWGPVRRCKRQDMLNAMAAITGTL